MTYRKGVEKFYNLQKVLNSYDLHLVTGGLTRVKSTLLGSISTLGVNKYGSHHIHRCLFMKPYICTILCSPLPRSL